MCLKPAVWNMKQWLTSLASFSELDGVATYAAKCIHNDVALTPGSDVFGDPFRRYGEPSLYNEKQIRIRMGSFGLRKSNSTIIPAESK